MSARARSASPAPACGSILNACHAAFRLSGAGRWPGGRAVLPRRSCGRVPVFDEQRASVRQFVGDTGAALLRWIDRGMRRYMKSENSHRCGVCMEPFCYDDITWGGVTDRGIITLVSDACCSHRLVHWNPIPGVYLASGQGWDVVAVEGLADVERLIKAGVTPRRTK